MSEHALTRIADALEGIARVMDNIDHWKAGFMDQVIAIRELLRCNRRGLIYDAVGETLDNLWGPALGVKRELRESDERYRGRLIAKMQSPHSARKTTACKIRFDDEFGLYNWDCRLGHVGSSDVSPGKCPGCSWSFFEPAGGL